LLHITITAAASLIARSTALSQSSPAPMLPMSEEVKNSEAEEILFHRLL
jgi:hypothetical protein